MFVVFITTVKFRINATYMVGVPVAEHDTWLPGSTLTAAFETILGGTSEVMFQFSQHCNLRYLRLLINSAGYTKKN